MKPLYALVMDFVEDHFAVAHLNVNLILSILNWLMTKVCQLHQVKFQELVAVYFVV